MVGKIRLGSGRETDTSNESHLCFDTVICTSSGHERDNSGIAIGGCLSPRGKRRQSLNRHQRWTDPQCGAMVREILAAGPRIDAGQAGSKSAQARQNRLMVWGQVKTHAQGGAR